MNTNYSLRARNPKNLDICLRLLYAEKIDFIVSVCENEKGKIYYSIYVLTNEEKYVEIHEKYRVLIS